MEIDKDIQIAIDEYVESINEKEEELLSFKSKVGVILSTSERDLEKEIEALDKDFNNNKIDEDTYLTKIKESKNKILDNTKEELNNLLSSLSS